jgi:Holliday junction resolvase RusA-like endonuclease
MPRSPLPSVDVSDRPFALPRRELISTVVDLPFPVSTNKLWTYGKRTVRPSIHYTRWRRAADALALTQKIGRMACIEGPFRAELLLIDGRRMDCDNIKCVLDTAQRWNLIVNDKYCREYTIKFVATHHAPHGARLTLVEIAS